MNKSPSDPYLSQSEVNLQDTPTSFVSLRYKRKRENDLNSEFTIFKDEIKEMFNSWITGQLNEFKKINPTLTEIKDTMNFLSAQNEELKSKIEKLEQNTRKDREYITILEDKLENLQRENRKSNIQIQNVPKINKETREDLINMVLCLSKEIDCKIDRSDIRDIYRIRNKRDDRLDMPIIIETSSNILKTDILKMCKAHNIKRNKDKLCAKHLGLTVNENSPIYVSEHLTAKAARLYFLARDLVKSKNFKFCWTSYGRVYIRKNEDSPVITITSETQIHKLNTLA